MNNFLQNLINYETDNKFRTLEYFLDITSNEIFFDDVFLYRLFDWKIKQIAVDSGSNDESLLAMVLYEIIWRILQKGGQPRDETGDFQTVIDNYKNNFINQQLAMELAHFQIQHPDYGNDWRGIWFYPSDLTTKLAQQLGAGEQA